MLTEKDCFICQVLVTKLGTHLHKKHPNISDKEYYDLYLNENDSHLCANCGKKNAFINLSQGYRKHCSKRCSSLNRATQEKLKKTNFERYGVEWTFQSDNNKRKSRETLIDRYGVSHQMRNRDVKEKVSKTNIERYGAENVFASNEIKERIKKTNLDRYGVEFASQNHDVSNKIFNTKLERYNDGKYLNIEQGRKTKLERYGDGSYNNGLKQKETREKLKYIIEKKYNCTLLDTVKNIYGIRWYKANIFEILVFPEDSRMNFIKNDDIPKIEEYLKNTKNVTIFQKEVTDFIMLSLFGESLKDSEIKKILINDRKAISPYELDIYIPHLNLAIECDGVYWHSTNNGVSKNYHSNKTKQCENFGIRLLHITDWEWNNRKEICKSIIRLALNAPLEIIDSKDCVVKEISSVMAKNFFDKNHLNGAVGSESNYGLFYNKKLVQVISINGSKNVIESTALNTKVINGFSKLLSYQPFDKLFSYIDKSKFTGIEYFNSGFVVEEEIEENYSYYKRNIRIANNIELKNVIINYDDNLTEFENMSNNSWLQVYDCGKLKLRYKKGIE